MAGSKISFSYEAIGSEILRAPWMVEHMKARAQRVMDLAQSRAPVYEGPGPDPTRGSYKESFRIESTDRGGIRHDRAEASVINDDAAAVFIEFGTAAHDGVAAQPARHILGSSMMAAAGDE